MLRITYVAAIAVCAGLVPAAACDLKESYLARLGPADHFNSSGERLTSAAAIIRQDRANYHQFGKRDEEDDGDDFFGSKEIVQRWNACWKMERPRRPPSPRSSMARL